MKVDLLRQLDEWGSHLEEGIDHVEAVDVLEHPRAKRDSYFKGGLMQSEVADASESAGPAPKPVRHESPRWRIPIRVAGVAAVLVAIVMAVPLLGREASREFSSVGAAIGGDFSGSREAGPGTTRAPASAMTAAPATSAAPATTAAPTTTVPAVTPAPGGTVPPAGNNPANLGRDVIFTGDLAIDTRDVSAAVVAARAIVQSSGGYVFGQELGGSATVMSLKIPAEFFEDAVERLSELGTVRTARITSQDVTERIVDLESQVSTSEVSVERLRTLLAQADNINAVTRLESELLDRETQLERLRGQLRTLQDQVALSTIVLTLREFVPSPALLVNVTVHEIGDETGDQCFTAERRKPTLGDDYVVCVDVTNTGNLAITDIEIRGPDTLVADLAPVRGNRLTGLAPGERQVLWATARATESVREEITVQAVPLSEDGERLLEQTIEVRRPLNVTVVTPPEPEPEPEPDPDGLPSLGDALAAGWNVLSTGVNALAVAVAFVLPLLWIPLLAGLFVWWRRRRS